VLGFGALQACTIGAGIFALIFLSFGLGFFEDYIVLYNNCITDHLNNYNLFYGLP